MISCRYDYGEDEEEMPWRKNVCSFVVAGA